MMKCVVLFTLISVFGLIGISTQAAPRSLPEALSIDQDIGTSYDSAFDPNTIEILNGEVEDIETITRSESEIDLRVLTASGLLNVRLGPEWFIENRNMQIEAGDRIEFAGSRINVHGVPLVIATAVANGDMFIRLRDLNGTPFWTEQNRQEHNKPALFQ